MAVMAKRKTEVIPNMVAHLHTVLRLHQKAPSCTAWIEYDIQFRMEVAAADDKTWSSGDPWQYVSCLPGPGRAVDPFDMAEQHVVPSGEPKQVLPGIASLSPHIGTPGQSGAVTKGKRPLDQGNSQNTKGLGKRPKKPGLCRLFDRAPSGCPYGNDCVFVHRCSICGANDHGRATCLRPQKLGLETGGICL